MKLGTEYDPRWAFIVRVLGTRHVIFQTDDEARAIRYCSECFAPSRVIRTSDDESIYCNIDHPHNC